VNVKKDIRFRVYIAFTCICLLGLAIILKAASIQVNEGNELRQLARDMHLRTDTLYAERGNIMTEDGQLLCSSIPQFDIHLDPSVVKPDTFYKYLDTLSSGIYQVLRTKTPGIYKAELKRAYQDSNHYYELCRNITYDKYQALRLLPVFKLGKRRGGFIADPETKRINPYGSLAFRTIGLWRKNAQSVGLEAKYDTLLRGTNGSRILQKMTGGVFMPVEGTEYEPLNGLDVETTIDLNIQNVAEHSLMSVLQQYQCLYGTAIVMEVKTGKIRALVNLGRDSASGNYLEKENYALKPAEPGSTFKLVTLLSLLNDGLIKVEDNVNCEGGAIAFGNRVMRDSHLGLGVLSIKDAYAHSSNAAMAKLASQNYYKEPEKFIAHLQKLQIDKKTGIDIGGETSPRLLKPGQRDWNNTTLPWLATGYGVMINPLRTCMLYNGIANDGRMMKPYLVNAVRQYGKVVEQFEPVAVLERMGDTSTIRQLQDCVKEVVLSGTAHHIMSPHYGIGGKTGTAQVADQIEGRWYPYSAGIYQGSFVGYFPTDKPKYTICVVIRTRPHAGSYYGGLLAAPVFRMISDKIFASGMGAWSGPLDSVAKVSEKKVSGRQTTLASYNEVMSALGMSVIKDAVDKRAIAEVTVDTGRNVRLRPKQLIKGIVPDVAGMSLRDAVYLLETSGLQVQVVGRGRVQWQSLPAGTSSSKGQPITIQLS
jgi:cell division protein FtsI (penicillin-binding protein 3)